MKQLKFIIFFLLIFFFFISSNCNKSCEGYYIYEVTGYTDTLLQFYTDENGNLIRNYLSKNEQTPYDKLIIQIVAELQEVEVTNWCSYMEDSIVGKIDTIIITSNKNYNENHPANSNLNDCFFLLHRNISLSQYMLKQKPPIGEEVYCLLVPPAKEEIFTFNFYIKTNNNEFNIETYPVKITP